MRADRRDPVVADQKDAVVFIDRRGPFAR